MLTVLVLAVCAITVLLAVPDLRPVVHEIRTMNPDLVAAAVGLELASCLGFVVTFRLFFAGLPKPAARGVAWIQMGSGALLPGGGVGGLLALSIAVGLGCYTSCSSWRLTRSSVRSASGTAIGRRCVTVMRMARSRSGDGALRSSALGLGSGW